jgi:hypothetical protein
VKVVELNGEQGRGYCLIPEENIMLPAGWMNRAALIEISQMGNEYN